MLNAYLILAVAEEAPSPVIPKPAEIVVGVIAFSILLFIMKIRVVPLFEKAYQTRTEAIQGGLEKAESAQRDAEVVLRKYTIALESAQEEAAKTRDDARVQGAVILEELRAKAQEEGARITSAAQAAIESERQQAITSLRSEVGALAVELASKIVGESLEDQARQSRVVDRFLDDLEKSQK